MNGQRKKIRDKEYTLNSIIHNLIYFRNSFDDDTIGSSEFDLSIKSLEKIKEKLALNQEKLPVGHVYEGIYFQKNPYNEFSKTGVQFRKEEGKLFMREDLQSWHKENDLNNYRGIYLSENVNNILKRDDGKETFSIPENFN